MGVLGNRAVRGTEDTALVVSWIPPEASVIKVGMSHTLPSKFLDNQGVCGLKRKG